MMKFLLTVLVVGLGLLLLLGKLRPSAPRRPATPPAPPPPTTPQPMLACARCGLHLPRHEAYLDDAGQPYCGAEHRRLGAAR